MERRGFLKSSSLAGAALIPGLSSFSSHAEKPAEKTFNLNYAFHDGMFAAHAGSNFIDQIK
ncbi:MAG: hypothetical protein RLZZ42_387, partial [Bacteroidota bacterium]